MEKILKELFNDQLSNNEIIEILGKIEQVIDKTREDLASKREYIKEKETKEQNDELIFSQSVAADGALARLYRFICSPTCELLVKNRLLIYGNWGVGKTHFLCDFTKYLSKESAIVILSLAQNFVGENPLSDIACKIGGLKNVEELCEEMLRLNDKRNTRAIFIIDGINEGSEYFWKRAVIKISDLSIKYPSIGFILMGCKP